MTVMDFDSLGFRYDPFRLWGTGSNWSRTTDCHSPPLAGPSLPHPCPASELPIPNAGGLRLCCAKVPAVQYRYREDNCCVTTGATIMTVYRQGSDLPSSFLIVALDFFPQRFGAVSMSCALRLGGIEMLKQ